jgi:hypothetical protein
MSKRLDSLSVPTPEAIAGAATPKRRAGLVSQGIDGGRGLKRAKDFGRREDEATRVAVTIIREELLLTDRLAITELNESFGAGYAASEDETPEASETPDPFTVCCEQSRGVAGDEAILGDGLVDKVAGHKKVKSVASLDALREAEAEADAAEWGDYGATKLDHQV